MNKLLKDFKEFISNVCRNAVVQGWSAFVVKEKLRLLKSELKVWNKKVFGSLDQELEVISENVLNIDLEGEEVSLSLEKINLRQSLLEEWWKFSKLKDNLLFQKSKCRWLKQGDANTKFFHACIRSRRSRNQILGLSVDGHWCEDVSMLSEWVTNHFRNQFSESSVRRPRLDGVTFSMLSEVQQIMLCAEFSEDEIKAVVWSCVRDKSPEPADFNFTFFQDF
ncbi:unnamed protein product [Lupinus luteus]|uniref:Uncharacterized protein n=1 Tax=Lupinus luteus TaxID=3873 RepID=A0AAV1YFL2_LUPLU